MKHSSSVSRRRLRRFPLGLAIIALILVNTDALAGRFGSVAPHPRQEIAAVESLGYRQPHQCQEGRHQVLELDRSHQAIAALDPRGRG